MTDMFGTRSTDSTNSDRTIFSTDGTIKVIFFAFLLVLFILSFARFIYRPSTVDFLLLSVPLVIPVLLFNSFETLERNKRDISAKFMLMLGVTSLLSASLILAVTAPLTVLLDPNALKSIPADQQMAPAAYIVPKVYSLFDVMTLLGIIATLALVIMASLIPEEARLLQESTKHLAERIRVTDDLFKITIKLRSSDPATLEYDSLLLEKHRVWLLLTSLLKDKNAIPHLTQLGLKLDQALCLDLPLHARVNNMRSRQPELVVIHEQISELVRRE